jgi:menaquinone-dependent protoporphyrinogen oxidase
MSRVLIVYGSTYGQTERIARQIGRILTGLGHEVDLRCGDRLSRGLHLEEYDGVLVAASVILGRYQRSIRRFVRRNALQLNTMPSAFASVSGSPTSDPMRAEAYVDRFLTKTGWWRPTETRSFAGAVAYTRYNPLLRWWMQRISSRKGLPTDTSRDWDFTEWDEVERFARELAVLLAPEPVAEPALRAARGPMAVAV